MNLSQLTPLARSLATRLAPHVLEADWLDFAVNHVDPLWSLQRIKARVSAINTETADIKRFELVPNQNWTGHQPGQYLSVRVNIDGVLHERCYSLTSRPQSDRIEIAVKRQPHGKVSNWLHDHLQVGDVVELSAAAGDFVLPTPMPSAMLLLAGGSGITPVYSLLCDALARDPQLDVHLIYYANSAQDLAFFAPLQALAAQHAGFVLHTALMEQGQAARFGLEQLTALCPDFATRRTWICGPQGLMQGALDLWAAQGIAQQITCEWFGPCQQGSTVGSLNQPVTLRRSQQVFAHTASTLLESAEAAGARPAFGCRIGVCKQCTCTKVSGTVRDRITGAIDSNPNTAIRLCISEPLSAVELDI